MKRPDPPPEKTVEERLREAEADLRDAKETVADLLRRLKVLEGIIL